MDRTSDNEEAFIKTQAKIQRERKQTLQDACDKLHIHSDVMLENMYYDSKHKLVYCSVPKIASTNWKLVFEKLVGIVKDEQATQLNINRGLKKGLRTLDNFTTLDAAMTAWNNSLTFMFSRHPFSRVLSTYRNKLDIRTTFERAYLWQHFYSKKYRKKYGQTTYRGTPSFAQFVRLIGDPYPVMGYERNKHWSEVSSRCSPCDINYDVIGKLETLADDVKYILKLAELEGKVQFSDPLKSSPTFSSNVDTMKKYYSKVPKECIENLYTRYKFDFELFGYDLPDYIKINKPSSS